MKGKQGVGYMEGTGERATERMEGGGEKESEVIRERKLRKPSV